MKIVICGNYGAENLGDELILEGLLETLKVAAPEAEITVMSGNPKETKWLYRQKYGIEVVEKFPSGFRSILKSVFSKSKVKEAIENCDYFILGGGGLFNDLHWRASLIWANQVRQAIKENKKVIMYGQSIGPLNDFGKNLVKNIFNKASFIGVRDEDSATELKTLGITKEIIITPDLAFRIPVPAPKPAPVLTTPTVIISLRRLGNMDDNFVKEFATFCNWLIEEKKCRLKFMQFQQGIDSDRDLHQEVIDQINQRDRVININPAINADSLLATFQKADFVFAMRMHAIICAMKTCKPFLAISYSKKIDSLIKDSDLGEYIIGHDHIYFEQLKNFFILLNEKKDKVKTKLQVLNVVNLDKLKKAEIKLKDFLK
ncbi:MAG: polysaccharide pyruvyl transferase family protein [Candidatus Peregrinibacteria bacterium]|nr:polysaccharide pyruvyl transferase family protein [Candidatus Peregrinibacteria bacterium]